MKRVKQIFITLFLSLLFFSNCNNPESAIDKPAEPSSAVSQKPSDSSNTSSPWIIECVENPENRFCLENKSKPNNTQLIEYPEVRLVRYIKSGNEWRRDTSCLILKEEGSYCEFGKEIELVKIDGKDYLYFMYQSGSLGNATDYTDLHFVLFSLKDFKQTVLLYGGSPVYTNGNDGKIKGAYTNLAEFKNKTSFLNFLQKKVSSSPFVYQYKEEDQDMCLAQNYRERWKLDNPDVDIYFPLFKKETSLKITYYDESIFPDKNSSSFDFIENNKYSAVTLFRGDVLAYDKTKKKYFPVLVNECSHGCNKSISFKSENLLEITYSEASNEKIIVDLSTMIYKGE